MRTRVTELLGIEYPIFQGGMAWISEATLAAAVSNAGGLGIIAAGNMPAELLRAEIRKARRLTDKPFAVNIMLMNPSVDGVVSVVLEEKPPVVVTGAGSPRKFVPALRAAGIKIIPVVPGTALARMAERDGVDAVIAEGTESGGHIGENATMALVPQVVRAVKIPVIAAGGIADGAGVAAALCLGAEGVQCGTVFLASAECKISDGYKNMIIKAGDNATAVTGRGTGLAVRAIKNGLTRTLSDMERDGKSKEEIENLTVGSLRRAVVDGDIDGGSLMAGQIAGLVNRVRPAADIIKGMFADAVQILEEKALKYCK
ncbi:MAG: nitronate monooxygenase [Clostridiales bacterium]|jgi:enoyl-[acyl-carrier protein] reductase II|nr:nitronate monooxygenase [Clostridiales bacterium]